MYKQELIDKWESKTGAPAFETEEAAESASNDDMYTFGYGVARTEIIEDLKQLDEPQKPVVPKFVAELLDYYRQSTDVDLLALLITFHDWYYRKTKDGEHEEAIDWLVDHPEIYMRAWLDGYEVEK
ncbi:DUF1642 domain-containing protein [Enterococcus faecium]|uniref:DUF1642 domain-containing protein n=1 Tax=Enterococcus faecium TaxID=1352 RepID=UPI002FDC3B37